MILVGGVPPPLNREVPLQAAGHLYAVVKVLRLSASSSFGQQAHYSTPVKPMLVEILRARTLNLPEFRSGLRYANTIIQINFFFIGQLYW